MASNDFTDIEREYCPSYFTKRFQNSAKPYEEVLKHFVNTSIKATSQARKLYKTHLDVRYGGENDNQLVDIYYKNQEQGTPIFVFIHGGFWQLLDKSASGTLVPTIIERDYRVLLLDYDLCPKVTLQEITQQMLNFFKWLQVYAEETRAPKIHLCGHSAGAHLALYCFANDGLQPLINLIGNLFLISGVYDICQLHQLRSVNPDNILSLNQDNAREMSPYFWSSDYYHRVANHKIKFHNLVAENDSSGFKKQSYDFTQMLLKMQLNAKYEIFDSYDHFDIIEECMNTNSAICQYILREMGEVE